MLTNGAAVLGAVGVAAVLALGLAADPRAAAADDGGAPAPAPLPACIQVATQARYVPYGYNHIVTLRSGCSKPATCTVSTDVNPQPSVNEVPPNASVDVLTFSASPSSTFQARVACRLH